MSLPALVVFSVREANNGVRYLNFFGPHRLLRFRLEEGVYGDTVKFAVEPAKDGLVHIRSCYENYYWASGKASKLEPWLVASAPEKVEDMSKDECTLFRPLISSGNDVVGFVHAQSGLNVVMRPDGDMRAHKLYLDRDAAPTYFNFLDFAPLSKTKLPRYVTFSIGDNNKFISTEKPGNIKLSEYDNPTSREVGFEVLYDHSGDIRIKSMNTNEYLCVLPTDAKVATITNTVPEFRLATLFNTAVSSPPNAPTDGIALRSVVYNKFLSINNDNDLVAESNTPHVFNSWVRPKQLTTIGQTRVNIKNFRHAWTGPKSFRNVRKINMTNTKFTSFERDIPTQYQKFTKLGFGNSFPLVEGDTAVFNGRIPKVGPNGELEFPDVATDVITTWGNNKRVALIEKEYARLVLPPRSKVIATLAINMVTYELPFSYQQIDEFKLGGTETQYLNDGVLKIESEYGVEFKYDDIQPLSSEVLDDENIETDLKMLEREGINAIDDGIETNGCI